MGRHSSRSVRARTRPPTSPDFLSTKFESNPKSATRRDVLLLRSACEDDGGHSLGRCVVLLANQFHLPLPKEFYSSWATVPVKITELGASLEAYINTKKQIQALKTCCRFGKGPEAHVTRLPNELIDMIVEELLESPRAECLALWGKDFKCFEEKCDVRDHYTSEEVCRTCVLLQWRFLWTDADGWADSGNV